MHRRSYGVCLFSRLPLPAPYSQLDAAPALPNVVRRQP
jgi:hypothetical protein